jgi:hypothetical protein
MPKSQFNRTLTKFQNRITIKFPNSKHFCLQKCNWRGTILAILLALSLIFALPNQPVKAASLTAVAPKLHVEEKHVSIKNLDEALMYINAQNLVDTWNNIIIQAKTGNEQLKLMRESGVFADDVKLTFDFGDTKYALKNLKDSETQKFYNGFVNSLKKNRYNIASNIEAVKFSKDSLRFNFKHWIFLNDKLSVVGEDQAVMKREGDRYLLTSADIRVVYFDVAHAY